jgi:thiazole synthase ThiGH ThiG subunit
MATAVADVAAARHDYMDESGGRYVHVIADGGFGASGDLPKAIACGADAVMMGSPLPAPRSPAPPTRRAGASTGAWRRSTPNCRAASG